MASVDDTDVVLKLLLVLRPEEATRWLTSPNPNLDGRTPDATIQAGGKKQVLELVNGLTTSLAKD